MDHHPNNSNGEARQYTLNITECEPVYLLRDERVLVISLNLMQLLQLISSYVHLNLIFTLTCLLIQNDPKRYHSMSCHSNRNTLSTISSANLSITGRPWLFNREYRALLELATMTVCPSGKLILSPACVDCANSCDVSIYSLISIVREDHLPWLNHH